jgi:hypothetical protein
VVPFPSLHMLSKKDELWRNIQTMRVKGNIVDMWLKEVEHTVDGHTEFWDFLPDTLILPDEWDRCIMLNNTNTLQYFQFSVSVI